MAEAQDLKHLLIETNQEYRQLASKHHALDDRLHELDLKHYLSDSEQFEEVSLKKRKAAAQRPYGIDRAGAARSPTGDRPVRVTLVRPGSLRRTIGPGPLADPAPLQAHGRGMSRYHRIRWDRSRGLAVHPRRPRRCRSAPGSWLGRVWSVPFLVLAGVLPVLLPRSRPHIRRRAPTSWCRRPTRASWSPAMPPGPARRPGSGSRSACSCRRWTCTSTAPRSTGRVTRVEYHPGKFLPAYREEAGELNEWTEVWFDRAGAARRRAGRSSASWRGASCAGSRSGDEVARGERFGVMKFGSRIDLFLPRTRDVLVQGRAIKVVGGETTIATLAP